MEKDLRKTFRRSGRRVAGVVGVLGGIALLATMQVRTIEGGGRNSGPSVLRGGSPSVAGADTVLRWNEIMEQSLASQNPFAAGRLAAMTQVAVFEAVNSITGDYESYAGGVPAAPGASPEAAAISAAHAVLVQVVPALAPTLDEHLQASLDALPESASTTEGVAVGQAAAALIIALRANDGATPPQFHTPTTSDPGEWQPTPACPPAGGVLLHWGNVAMFGLESSAQFRAVPPPAMDSGKYAKDFNEVRIVGSSTSGARPADRADVAQFYNVVLAVGTWNMVARQLAVAQGTTLPETVRALALLNVAISDSLVTVMESKYHYRMWRPETAIHAAAGDGNHRTAEDPTYQPFITTPCFPTYPSAHASSAGAAARVVEKFWGPAGHAITLTAPQLPAVVLNYWRIDEITADIDDARVYGGIHFRFDQEAGAHQGRAIGSYLLDTVMRPVQ
jgi:hypothetical protein